mmetsp:Transcript_5990/g.19809  ORF Transcript_5990/g.19809 Transcript_5990/m.19809 type:complete len:554 (-) Transcript_5990:1527-3188(-)
MVLGLHGDLTLLCGSSCLSKIPLPNLLPANCWMLPHARGNVRFLDASSESMSIDFRHNQHLALINASMTSESAVAELILLALDAAIPEQLSFILRSRVVETAKALSSMRICRVAAMEASWYGFISTLNAILGAHAGEFSVRDGTETCSLAIWDGLMESEIHNKHRDQAGDLNIVLPVGVETPARFLSHRRHWCHVGSKSADQTSNCLSGKDWVVQRDSICVALHAVYEDCKLCLLTWSYLKPFGTFLSTLCTTSLTYFNNQMLANYYARDIGLCHEKGACNADGVYLDSSHLSVQEFFSQLFRGSSDNTRTQKRTLGPRAQQLCHIFDVLSDPVGLQARIPSQGLVLEMVRASLSCDELHTLTPGVVLPLHDAMQFFHSRPPSGWPTKAYELVGRSDLALIDLIAGCGYEKNGNDDSWTDVRPLCGTRASRTQKAHHTGLDGNRRIEMRDEDGLIHVENLAALRFGDDSRTLEVCRLLRSSKPVFFRLEHPPEMSDHDFEQRKQATLLLACTRSYSTTLGRSMLTLGSLPAFRTLAEILPVSLLRYLIRFYTS